MEIQRLLIREGFLPEGSDDDDYGPQTSVGVGKFQYSRWLAVDGSWGMTSDGLGFPPEGAEFGVDYSFSRPGGAMLAERGVNHAGRYLYQLTWSQGTSKGISQAEYQDLLAHNIKPFWLYEEAAEDVISGFDVGVAQAQRAEAHRIREGLPAEVIHFNWDKDFLPSQAPGLIDGLRGAASIVGADRVGLYAEYDAIKAAFDAGVIVSGFQTYAWSSGKWDPRAQYRQWSNGQWGGSVDFVWFMPGAAGPK